MALDIVVSGATGRMGQALDRLIQEAPDLRAIGGIARTDAAADRTDGSGYPSIVDVAEAGDLLRRCAVLVDFSAPDQLGRLLDAHADTLKGRALVVGTTGIEADLEARLDGLAEAAAVLSAPNFSVGVNLLIGLVERAARVLPAGLYDVEIVEAHHARKEDAPSGTALALGRAVADARGVALDQVRRDGRSGRPGARPAGEIGLHALRGGDVVGEHKVHFIAARERLVLGHAAQSRDLFAEGALVAARWVSGREPGRYTMAQALGLDG
jgi:4-hydroxy-tetrahydrodipicolinate reductase